MTAIVKLPADKAAVQDRCESPRGYEAVVPSDTNPITMCYGLYIGVAGVVKVRTKLGDVVSLDVAQGFLPGYFDMVYDTETTAAGIFALYH